MPEIDPNPGFWKSPPGMRVKGAGQFAAFDLMFTMALDKETPLGDKVFRAAKIGAAMYFAPALLSAYWLAEFGVAGAKMLAMSTEMDSARFGKAITPGFTNHDVFSTNMGQLLSERQRAITAIQTQTFNARSSLGSEATRMRRNVNDYLR